MTPTISLSEVPSGLWIAIGILAAIQIALDVIALIDLARRPRDRVTFGMKWPWVLIIVAVNLIGAVVYLGAGRRPAAAVEQPRDTRRESGSVAPNTVADSLYGRREDPR